MKVTTKTWLDELVELYDFVWSEGLSAHTGCINRELMNDFAMGGKVFEEMKKSIVKKFPTKDEMLKAFRIHQKNAPSIW